MAVRVDPFARWRDTCRSCTAPVLWATTAKGERMPVNPKPTSRGNVVLTIEPAAGPERPARLVAGVLNRGQAAGAHDRGVLLRTSHFVDCPRAGHHRRSRRP